MAEAPAPPPAAYPDSGGIPADSSGAPASPGGMVSALAPSSAPPAAPAPAAPQPFALREGEQLVPHLIESGENLSVIATKYNTTVGRIQAANGMTDTTIFAGKTIQVPTQAAPNLAMGAAEPGTGGPAGGAAYGTAGDSSHAGNPAAGSHVAPTAPTPPSGPTVPGGNVPAPPLPPSSTSYPRSDAAPSGAQPPTVPTPGAFPTPSFQAGQ